MATITTPRSKFFSFLNSFVSPAPAPTPEVVEEAKATPPLTLVSFYTEGGYYEEKAVELRQQCDRLGMAHDIAPITLGPDDDWASICRRKVSFYREMLHKHKSTIMWVDVDSILLKNLNDLAEGAFDIGLFMRNFKYMPQFNPALLARTFHPGYLMFRYTPATIALLEDTARVEAENDGAYTDDFILEEAFRTSEAQPRLLLLSPKDILKPGDEDHDDALFRHGDSGNVNEFKGKVRQHVARGLAPDAQRLVLNEVIKKASTVAGRPHAIFLLEYMVDLDPTDLKTYLKLLDILKRAKLKDKLAARLESGLEMPVLRPYALRFQLIEALAAKKWAEADAVFEQIKETGDAKVIAFARSRLFRFSLDRRAEAASIPDADRVKLFWWEEPHPGNLGDIINPYIVEKLTGRPPKFAPRGVGMCAIGSVIKWAKSGTPVWGSGSPHENDTLAPDAVYHAVRGPYTRDLVLRNGGTCPEVYGDAGWFLPILYRPDVKKTHKTGLILHFQHEEAPLDVSPDIRRIDIRRLGYDEIEAFLDEMLSCERIVSTSLHGVIIAQAYGIPACLGTVTNAQQQIHGDGIKFKDYYASVGVMTPPKPVDLATFDKISSDTFSTGDFTPIGNKIDLESLLKAAPFTALPEMYMRARDFAAD
ncbi:hypothetical protein JANAI62_18660 [Jannaschia pagri]|uniref:Polysaccharide pyruvyl transferase domain-containing protein n=1 Tax=Jannaschia pagri TaxID=2829797 RepID=A0ABQ4NLF0_9RHOB|nr:MULTISPECIES: polysaccharide pyruvyl transferase family protein [unclassified Jannaschia]GIT91409.1 hypothetical protein JANAI61_18670 [Jannaschia sp. AI_61]GIT95243.1 hypothetical protein JANAI62_18660 [Jannaschia sp. AI_62]